MLFQFASEVGETSFEPFLQENAGNDPNTQLVPSGGTGGWQKPDIKEEAVDETAPIIAAGSSWASGPQISSGVPSWQPPQPFPVAAAATPTPRSLNPHEYPSLTAAASTKQSSAPKQAVSHMPSGSQVCAQPWHPYMVGEACLCLECLSGAVSGKVGPGRLFDLHGSVSGCGG